MCVGKEHRPECLRDRWIATYLCFVRVVVVLSWIVGMVMMESPSSTMDTLSPVKLIIHEHEVRVLCEWYCFAYDCSALAVWT